MASPKQKSYAQCCGCSLGTATTIWASFQIVLAVFQYVGGQASATVFVAGAVVSLLTAAFQLAAAVQRNPSAAYMAFHLQIMTLLLWLVQFFLIMTFLIHSCANRLAADSRIPIWKYVTGYSFAHYTEITVRGVVLFPCLLVFYLVIFVASFFILRFLWSFYLVLQAGGTAFECKRAEDIEAGLLHARVPSMPGYHATDNYGPAAR